MEGGPQMNTCDTSSAMKGTLRIGSGLGGRGGRVIISRPGVLLGAGPAGRLQCPGHPRGARHPADCLAPLAAGGGLSSSSAFVCSAALSLLASLGHASLATPMVRQPTAPLHIHTKQIQSTGFAPWHSC